MPRWTRNAPVWARFYSAQGREQVTDADRWPTREEAEPDGADD